MGTQAFSAQYQQRPIPLEGVLVKRAWFKTFGKAPEYPYASIVQSWDTATKIGPGTDYSACVTAAVIKGDVYVLDVHRGRYETPGLLRKMRAHAWAWKTNILLIEDVGVGTSLIQQLRTDRHDGVPLPMAFRPRLDKLSRLGIVSPRIERGEVYLPSDAPWMGEFLNELLAFPAAKHDDQVDAFSQLLSWVDDKERAGRAVRVSMFGHRKPGTVFAVG